MELRPAPLLFRLSALTTKPHVLFNPPRSFNTLVIGNLLILTTLISCKRAYKTFDVVRRERTAQWSLGSDQWSLESYTQTFIYFI